MGSSLALESPFDEHFAWALAWMTRLGESALPSPGAVSAAWQERSLVLISLPNKDVKTPGLFPAYQVLDLTGADVEAPWPQYSLHNRIA